MVGNCKEYDWKISDKSLGKIYVGKFFWMVIEFEDKFEIYVNVF